MRSFVLSRDESQTVLESVDDDRVFVLSKPSAPSIKADDAVRFFVWSGSPPRGLKGDTGGVGPSGSGIIYVYKQNAAIDGMIKGTLVYDVNATQMNRAIANSALKKDVMAMVSDSLISPGASGATIISGLITQLTSEWDTLLGTVGGLVPGKTYFLSGTDEGVMTLVPPTSGWVVAVGIAVSTTDFFVRIEPSIKL